MIEFAWLWAWLALPLPLLCYLLCAPLPATEAPLWVPFSRELAAGARQARARSPWRQPGLLLALLAWALLVAAAARPRWLGEEQLLPATGRDLLLAVDLSRSMLERDMELPGQGRVDRLRAIKQLAGDFLERREGDRIGLALFGERTYLQAPLTFDRGTVRTLLEETEVGLLGNKTAIGDAIGLAIKRLRDRPGDRVLVLLTDGANTAGEVDPLTAARYAAAAELRIYTVGIGSERRSLLDLFGRRRAAAELDEETLREVARLTGGHYFRARDARELEQIYRHIDELEPTASESQSFRPYEELYCWPLAPALLLGGAALWRRQRAA